MTTTIFLDECGYTGDDLLDAEQPTFSIATHSFSEAEAGELKRRFFGAVKAPELKHKSLQGRPRNQAAVIAFLRFLVENPGRAHVVFADKRFALTAKLVDIIVEPGMHRAGFNMYQDGFNAALTNLLFTILSGCAPTVLDELLVRFQNLARYRTEEFAQEFFSFVFQQQPIAPVNEVLNAVRAAAVAFQPTGHPGITESATGSFAHHCSHLGIHLARRTLADAHRPRSVVEHGSASTPVVRNLGPDRTPGTYRARRLLGAVSDRGRLDRVPKLEDQ